MSKKTLQECLDKTKIFPFVVSYSDLLGMSEEVLIVGKNKDKWYTEYGSYFIEERAFELLDYLDSGIVNISDRATVGDITHKFPWEAPAECNTCAPYWTTCRCA